MLITSPVGAKESGGGVGTQAWNSTIAGLSRLRLSAWGGGGGVIMARITERLWAPGSGRDPFTTASSPPSKGLCQVPISEENTVAQGPDMGSHWAVSWLHTGSLTPRGEDQFHADPCVL